MRRRVPQGGPGLEGPLKLPLVCAEAVHLAIGAGEKHAAMPGRACVEDRPPGPVRPEVLPRLGIDRVQYAVQRPDEQPPPSDHRLHAGHDPLVREGAIPLPLKRRPHLRGCCAAAAGIMSEHGPFRVLCTGGAGGQAYPQRRQNCQSPCHLFSPSRRTQLDLSLARDQDDRRAQRHGRCTMGPRSLSAVTSNRICSGYGTANRSAHGAAPAGGSRRRT